MLKRWQGHLMVSNSITVIMGLRLLPRPRRDRFPASFPRYEERLFKWNLSLCGHGLPEAAYSELNGALVKPSWREKWRVNFVMG